MGVRPCDWFLDEQIPEKILRLLEFDDWDILTGERMSQQADQKVRPARPQRVKGRRRTLWGARCDE
jgi:hypothetical protein